MFSHQIAFFIHNERQREIERRLAMRSVPGSQIVSRSFRRRVGQALIRAGSALAADAPMTLAPRRR